MPGILPMKVIKLGTSAQTRIAQACDRCRSKKIRCDGITPCCSQCSNVGFECKTSDKLSRRAFPRGYTESLEERVRALETEVKELKDLLDEKDEKIDILSRIHSSSSSLRRPSSTLSSSVDLAEARESIKESPPKEDIFRIQQSSCLLEGNDPDSYFMGASSGRSFVDAFKAKARESGKPCGELNTSAFFTTKRDPTSTGNLPASTVSRLPSRLNSDQMINIFFQEWAPLFPVVHRPTVLKTYAEYVADPQNVKDNHVIVQLNLIFGIAASSANLNNQNTGSFELQWQTAMDLVLSENTLPTLQCLLLAQIYCIAKGDYDQLLHYKGMAISLSHCLGLNQSQKRFPLDALTSETRKKIFWSLYTLDCFSAAILGLPRLLNEGDMYAEYPADVDDENVSEQGFQSTLPGESTRISSALVLFRLSRIISKVLDEVYPAVSSHELSLQKISALGDELDVWLGSLPSHLRLSFVQDKPSTNVVGSRSPFMSLAYHYTRTLIHRPVVSSTLGDKASSSVIALAQSSKHIIQVVQLLEERKLSFSFCLNKNELLLLAGFGLLFQGLDLDHKGKLIQDSQRLLCSVIQILERDGAHGSADFKKVVCAMISIDRFSKSARAQDDSGRSYGNMSAPKTVAKMGRRFQGIPAHSSTGTTPRVKRESDNGRRSTAPILPIENVPFYARSNSRNSVSSIISDPLAVQCHRRGKTSESPQANEPLRPPNLDYLSFNNDSTLSLQHLSPDSNANLKQYNQHDVLPGAIGHDSQHPLDGLFPSADLFSSYISTSPSGNIGWCSDTWNITSDCTQQPAKSRVSFSEEELTSGEELSNCELGVELHDMTLPAADELVGIDGLDGNFGL